MLGGPAYYGGRTTGNDARFCEQYLLTALNAIALLSQNGVFGAVGVDVDTSSACT